MVNSRLQFYSAGVLTGCASARVYVVVYSSNICSVAGSGASQRHPCVSSFSEDNAFFILCERVGVSVTKQ